MASRDSIPHRLLTLASQRPTATAYHEKVDGQWRPTTWEAYAHQVRTVARALIALGLPPGGRVAILGFNRPEWAIFDHAAMMAGGVPAGIYTTCSPDEVQYIVHHSESVIVLVESAAQLAKITARRAQLPSLRAVVLMRGTAAIDGALTWEDLLARGADAPDHAVDERLAALAPEHLATLIYTSGTTGPPKGVMLSHSNLCWTATTLAQLGEAKADEVSLSYLPLSHVAEQMGTIHIPATVGSCVYFAESLERLPDNLKECRPTVFFGVPRIWEKLHAGISARLAELTGVKRRLITWARRVCAEVHARGDRGDRVPPALALQYRLAQRLVLAKLKTALGFDRIRTLSSGAAPIAVDVLELFASLDLPIREIYGQSEDSGPTSVNLPGRTKLGTVGAPLPGIQVRLADDGEILVRGPHVFLGYFKDPEATAEALRDGWLCSGDLGSFDAEGFLTITGRKKEIIITAGGKNIAPKNIEAALKELKIVAEAVVIGDRRRYLTALITLDEAAARKLAAGAPGPATDADAAALATAPAVRAAIQARIDEVNATLARVEQVKKFAVLPRAFGVDSGELTPTLKLRRKVIAERFATEIEAMYAEPEGRGEPSSW
jgi:long-chain acyl-CoA synthetase